MADCDWSHNPYRLSSDLFFVVQCTEVDSLGMMVPGIDFDINVQEVGEAARWRHIGSRLSLGIAEATSVLLRESGLAPARVQELERRDDFMFDGYPAILRDSTDVYHG